MHESDDPPGPFAPSLPIYYPAAATAAGPAIPAQRAPLPVELDELPPLPFLPGAPLPPRHPRRGRVLLAGGSLALVAALAVTVGAAVYVTGNDALGEKATAAGARPTAGATPLTPADALEVQADALLKGDEKGWLAPVDPAQPKLRARYRAMFRALRGLGVSHFVYDTSTAPAEKTGVVKVSALVEYCFSTDRCPEEKAGQSDGPPTITQELTLKPAPGTGYVITALAESKDADDQQPTPWETGELVFAQGKRVTLIARAAEQKYFARVLAIADKAALVNDRFAALLNNPQKKYRIYLAGPRQWKTWYGGITDKWVIGYAMPLSDAGTDVVININEVRNDRRLLASTIQHELGHVVTLGGAYRTGGQGDMWMKEGIAEYIGWYPKPATASWRRPAVRDAVSGGNRPKSIAVKALSVKATPEASDAFYGLGHFAADCMSREYGQRALFTFVRLYLRENRDLDPASREAFGQPFATVDKACVAWTRDQA